MWYHCRAAFCLRCAYSTRSSRRVGPVHGGSGAMYPSTRFADILRRSAFDELANVQTTGCSVLLQSAVTVALSVYTLTTAHTSPSGTVPRSVRTKSDDDSSPSAAMPSQSRLPACSSSSDTTAAAGSRTMNSVVECGSLYGRSRLPCSNSNVHIRDVRVYLCQQRSKHTAVTGSSHRPAGHHGASGANAVRRQHHLQQERRGSWGH